MRYVNTEEYYSSMATRQVLGCLILNPMLLAEKKLNKFDFMDSFHQAIFYAINNNYQAGITKLDAPTIHSYLKENYPGLFKIFSRINGVKFIQDITNPKFVKPENFNGYCQELKKFTLLRKLAKNGYDVSDYFDPEEIDATLNKEKRELFERSSVDDIIRRYRNNLNEISTEFSSKDGRDSVKAGSKRAKEQKESWKISPSFGLGYCSQYLTTVTSGLREKRLSIFSAPSGTGKTRVSVANLCYSFVPRYWDPKKEKWVDNPHGKNNSTVYIGTEMELIEEIEPILWSYIACVPTNHILEGKYEPGEEERVDEAIRILDEEANIYLEYVAQYDIATLENIIDFHVTRNNVKHVFFDYIHVTTELIAEFQSRAQAHMQVREDQILLNLGIKLKELCRKYNISIDTWTQVNGDAKSELNRDASVIRGAKSLADKADVCGVFTEVTSKEIKALQKILRGSNCFGKPLPNRCFSIYKNRGGKWTNIKIWLYIDYGTMRVEDLFCTNYEYKLSDIEKTYTAATEDRIISTTDKKELQKELEKARDAFEIERNYQEKSEFDNDKIDDNEINNEKTNNNETDEIELEPKKKEETEENKNNNGLGREISDEEFEKELRELYKNKEEKEDLENKEIEKDNNIEEKDLEKENLKKESKKPKEKEIEENEEEIKEEKKTIKRKTKSKEEPKEENMSIESPVEPPVVRKRGRPKGSKNKPKIKNSEVASEVLASSESSSVKITSKTDKDTIVVKNQKRKYNTGKRPTGKKMLC